MAHRNEIEIGENPSYNNMIMFRKVDDLPFYPQFVFDNDDNLAISSMIVVNYLEYYKNTDGVIIHELTKKKHYIVPNKEAVLNEEGEEIFPAWLAANGWFLTLARTPITAANGIMDSIEATLDGLPMDVVNGYILQSPL